MSGKGIWFGTCSCGAVCAAMVEVGDRKEIAEFVGEMILDGLNVARTEERVTISGHRIGCPRQSVVVLETPTSERGDEIRVTYRDWVKRGEVVRFLRNGATDPRDVTLDGKGELIAFADIKVEPDGLAARVKVLRGFMGTVPQTLVVGDVLQYVYKYDLKYPSPDVGLGRRDGLTGID